MAETRGLYLLLLLFSFIFPYFYGGKIPYMVFYVVLLLPCISFIHTLIIYSCFKYVQDIDNKYILKGEIVNIEIMFSNESFLPYPYLTAVFVGVDSFFSAETPSKKFSLPPYSNKSFTFRLKCMYRGCFEVGLERLEIVDLLGLFKLTYKIKSRRNLVVYPRIIKLENLDIREGFLYDSQNTLDAGQTDMTTISNIRKYSYGDVFKKIHWKLSAKMDDIMVKDFKNTYESSAVIILDLFRNNYSSEVNMDIEDRVVETAVSIINFCLSKCIPLNLLYYLDSVCETKAKSPLDFDNIYITLAEIKFDGDVPANDLLKLFLQSSIETTNLFLITSNIDYSLVDSLYSADISGYEVHLVYIEHNEPAVSDAKSIGHIFEFLPEINIKATRIESSDDIKLILEGAW